MKISWSWGITIFIILFMAGILLLVVKTSREKIDLVTEDYYPKGVEYQDEITKYSRAKKWGTAFNISENDQLVKLHFPKIPQENKWKGTVHFYRPSDKNLDLVYPIQINKDFTQTFEREKFMPGKYKVIIDWEWDSLEYKHAFLWVKQ